MSQGDIAGILENPSLITSQTHPNVKVSSPPRAGPVVVKVGSCIPQSVSEGSSLQVTISVEGVEEEKLICSGNPAWLVRGYTGVGYNTHSIKGYPGLSFTAHHGVFTSTRLIGRLF